MASLIQNKLIKLNIELKKFFLGNAWTYKQLFSNLTYKKILNCVLL